MFTYYLYFCLFLPYLDLELNSTANVDTYTSIELIVNVVGFDAWVSHFQKTFLSKQ